MPLALFLIVWLIVALVVSVSGLLHQVAVPIPLVGTILTILLLAMLAAWPSWRERALAKGLAPLIAFHLVRFVGIYFLWLNSLGVLPRNFAVPAGWGDIVVATLAIPLLLMRDWRSGGRRTFLIVWNVLGLVDILLVVANAARMARADPGFQQGFASLPLSLLPLYIVPLIIASHALIFYRLWRHPPALFDR
jgi:hypothetical protein